MYARVDSYEAESIGPFFSGQRLRFSQGIVLHHCKPAGPCLALGRHGKFMIRLEILGVGSRNWHTLATSNQVVAEAGQIGQWSIVCEHL